ncbi:MAG: helix-turn-helix domain-containing protein, partial [Terriglobales bacterium]
VSERSKLIHKLRNNLDSRTAYIKAKLGVLVPSQVRALRLQSDMPRQSDLAKAAEMHQSRISMFETPGASNLTLETLARLAAAFKVGLVVKFAPFSEMLRWENEYSQDAFHVTAIDADLDFIEPEVAQGGTESVSDSAAVALSGLPQSEQTAADLRPPRMPAAQFYDPLLREGWNEAISRYPGTSARVC